MAAACPHGRDTWHSPHAHPPRPNLKEQLVPRPDLQRRQSAIEIGRKQGLSKRRRTPTHQPLQPGIPQCLMLLSSAGPGASPHHSGWLWVARRGLGVNRLQQEQALCSPWGSQQVTCTNTHLESSHSPRYSILSSARGLPALGTPNPTCLCDTMHASRWSKHSYALNLSVKALAAGHLWGQF